MAVACNRCLHHTLRVDGALERTERRIMTEQISQPEKYNIAVYCGAGFGNDPLFVERAQQMGRACAERGIGVVYGGGSTGLMGTVAGAALDAGGKVYGVVTHQLVEWEGVYPGQTTLDIVDTMHQRKIAMINKADAFVAMPGGPGTLEEFFEVFSWQFLKIHDKPVALMNVNGYWTKLIEAMEYMSTTELLKPEYLQRLIVVETPEELMKVLGK